MSYLSLESINITIHLFKHMNSIVYFRIHSITGVMEDDTSTFLNKHHPPLMESLGSRSMEEDMGEGKS